MAKAATAKATEVVEIRPIEMKTVELTLIGDTSLIVHAWSAKAKKQMLDAQMGLAKGRKKEAKSPADDFIQSAYWLTPKPEYSAKATEEEKMIAFHQAIADGAKFGFPLTAFKQASISSAYRMGWIKNQMALRGTFFLESDYGDMAMIESDTPIMREDMVKIAGGTADIRYRPEFQNWHTTIRMKYNANSDFSLENIINIINAGGTICGVGEWRPERDGQFGMYHVKVD